MDQVKAAAEALRQIAATKKHKTDVEDSIHQFASTITLLELSSLSPNTFERLSSLLRARLLPLYYAFFELTLQYTNAILTVIFEEKITNTVFAGDDFIRSSWEMIQTSLISGVLDYLEAESTYEHRGTVGNALYPILCRFYLQEAPFKPTQTTGSLLSTVYQLLSETVISHPNNQRKLRDPGILGGKAIGRTLSQIKDFLAAEALLELFANLLPSLNGPTGRGKRTAYIKETFNPAFFTCSEEIITLLENITTIDWSVTAIKIMDTLATSDILFPQPFEVSRCIMQSKRINNVDRIYIDNYAFLANLDENGNLETIQIPYMTINSVALTSSSNNNTSVKVEVLSLPLVGGRPSAEISSTDNIGLSWEINTADVERFTSSLRKRGLGEKMKKSARKLSKAITQVELDFDAADGKVFSTSAQDKVQNIARLWDSDGSPGDYGLIQPTSPLTHGVAKSLLEYSNTTVVNATNMVGMQTTTSKPNAREDSPPVRKIRGKAVVGIDEDNLVLPGAEAKPVKKTSTAPAERTTRSRTRSRGKENAQLSAQRVNDTKIYDSPVAISAKLHGGKVNSSKIRKRKVEDEPTEIPDAKRAHIQRENEVSAEPEPVLPDLRSRMAAPIAKRYGRRGRASSPTFPAPQEVNFDKLPTTGKSSRLKPKMKTKDNSPNVKPAPAKAKPKPRPKKTKPKVPKTEVKETPADLVDVVMDEPNIELIFSTKPAAIIPMEAKVTRRSERMSIRKATAILTMGANPTEALNTTNLAKPQETHNAPESHPKKSENAPWEDLDMRKQELRLSTSPIRDTIGEPSTDNLNLMFNGSDDYSITMTYDPDTNYSDFLVPTKDCCPSLQPEPTETKEIVIIDLTQEDEIRPPKVEEINNPLDISPSVRTAVSPKSKSVSSPEPVSKEGLPSVAFASPLRSLHEDSPRSPIISIPSQKNNSSFGYLQTTDLPKNIAALLPDTQYSERKSPQNPFMNRKSDPLARILDVMNEITETIARKTTQRFDIVRKELRTGQRSILSDTAHHLQKMRTESVEHFNILVDLEEEYAVHSRRLLVGVDNFQKASQDVFQCVGDIIQDHNRRSLCKKFPTKLFAKPLPTFVVEPESAE